LAQANLEKEAATFKENEDKRAKVRSEAELRKKIQQEREATIKEEAEEKRRDYDSKMSRFGNELSQIRVQDARLRREEEEERQSMELKKIERKMEDIKHEKRVKKASRDKLSKHNGSFVRNYSYSFLRIPLMNSQFWWGVCRQPGCGKSVRSVDYYCGCNFFISTNILTNISLLDVQYFCLSGMLE